MRTGAWAVVDLDAIRDNVRWLRSTASPAALWAIVKANGYGHGAVAVARAALEAGAEGLGVALVAEGVELRRAGVEAPILLLSEPMPEEFDEAVAHRLEVMVYSLDGIRRIAAAAAARDRRAAVHLKIDTGMHRVGVAARDAVELARRVAEHPSLDLVAVATHLAVADEADNPYTAGQLTAIDRVLGDLDAAGLLPGRVHAANSAGAIGHPAARRSLVRAGISIYGLPPASSMASQLPALRPALSLRARVSYVKRLQTGDALSYGLKYRFDRDATVATVPIGYADGVPRRLHKTGGDVLIGGHRRPIVGVVTMDQLMVDCGDDTGVQRGDEVVLIGRQGDEEITATEWADKLDTIAYEIVCGISSRVPRIYVG